MRQIAPQIVCPQPRFITPPLTHTHTHSRKLGAALRRPHARRRRARRAADGLHPHLGGRAAAPPRARVRLVRRRQRARHALAGADRVWLTCAPWRRRVAPQDDGRGVGGRRDALHPAARRRRHGLAGVPRDARAAARGARGAAAAAAAAAREAGAVRCGAGFSGSRLVVQFVYVFVCVAG